ncbi:MAG TPA: 30S ribosomal protein S17 [Candidatus Paceibacterota bacterium]|uniref:Small ribosomal subunit protein uS17 n=1 Tax=uncultured Parcubacteria bacterium Rifle_16ft_4_minimus_7278 TaxID=1665143 RepID=A0A0H4TDV0_9BACT|nr:30S ribosomal protein S17, small subunit ribosomal protein S17 [uncultured Parcubacteria bacterium Rifle_16ft_4_minimus_7278]HXK34921.1 30S ribosomal protein S17 [Candidatus Paceibacterota bacterium]
MARKILKGKIISHKTDKTAVVVVNRFIKHEKYKKYFQTSKKYKAHDEKNEYAPGDVVLIQETRPISKEKHFIILKKA